MSDLAAILSDQREARDYLAEHPGHPGAILWLSDLVAEEVLMRKNPRAGNYQSGATSCAGRHGQGDLAPCLPAPPLGGETWT